MVVLWSLNGDLMLIHGDLMVISWGFHSHGGTSKMDGLDHGKSQPKMDDDWMMTGGTPVDGNLRNCFFFFLNGTC